MSAAPRVLRALRLALWWAALALAFTAVSAQRSCADHERCVALSRCPSLSRLASKGGLTAKERAKLRDTVCGWEASKSPRVCCPILPMDDCGPINIPDKIINGNTTIVREFPWAVRLGYRFRNQLYYRCGGSLITDRYVLTAAHCAHERQKPASVRLGEHDTESDVDCSVVAGQRICADRVVDVDVEEVVRHPDYVADSAKPTGLQNDIALLRLRRSVPFTTSVSPICLPVKLGASPPSNPNFTLIVAGWGKIGSDDDADTSRFLMKLFLSPIPHSECASRYAPYKYSVNEAVQMCAIGKEGSDVCQGDSGGPVSSFSVFGGQLRAVLRGVVSLGPPTCATAGVPAIFTRVSNFMPWILANLKT